MNSAGLIYHERIEPSRALELERWGGVLALCVLSGTVYVDRVEGLRADDYPNGTIDEGRAVIVFGPGRLRLVTGAEGAEVVALGTSDTALIDAIPPGTPNVRELWLDFTEINRLKRLSTHMIDKGELHRLAVLHEHYAALAALCALAVDESNGAQKKDTRYVERAIERFGENIESPIRLPDLAWQLGITEEYLSKLFRSQIGISPMKYFRIMKIDAAERLLSEGNYSVKEVSWKLGFASQHHFSKAFKAIRGYSPSECGSRAKGISDASAVHDLGKEVDPSSD